MFKSLIYLLVILCISIGDITAAELSSTSYYITSDVFSYFGRGATNSSVNTTNLFSSSEFCVGTNKSASYYIDSGFLNTLSDSSNQLRIVLSISPDTILANNTSQAEVRATIYDKYNNIATYATYPVYFTNFNNTNNKYGYFVGSKVVTPVNGIATIYFHASSNVSTNVIIYAYNPSSKYLDDSDKIYIIHGAAKKVLLTSNITNYSVGSSVSNIIFTVKIVDTYGNIVNTGAYTVTLTNSGYGSFSAGKTLIITNGVATFNFVPGNVKGDDVVMANCSGLESGTVTLNCESGEANKITLVSDRSNLVLNNGSSIVVRALLTDQFGNIDVNATNTVFFRVYIGNISIMTQYAKATNGEASLLYRENKYAGKVTVLCANKDLGTNYMSVYVDIDGEIGGTVFDWQDINYTVNIAAGAYSGYIRVNFEVESNINLANSDIQSTILNNIGYKISMYDINDNRINKNILPSALEIMPELMVNYDGISNYNNEILWFYDEFSKGSSPVNSYNDKVNKLIRYNMERCGIYFLGSKQIADNSKMYNLYPNPFNPLNGNLNITFNIKNDDNIRVEVYDISGQHIKTLLSEESKEAGVYTLEWDGKDSSGNIVGSGNYIIYVYGKKTGSYSKIVSLLKLKE